MPIRIRLPLLLLALTTLTAAAAPAPAHLKSTPVPLPGGAGGIGFDDLTFVPELGKLVVPAGRSGNLDLLDPASGKITPIGGFQKSEAGKGGHGEGTSLGRLRTRARIFAIDRSALKLVVVDPKSGKAVASAPLASSPDYVRFVAPTGEVWVTEPDSERIEVFTLAKTGEPVPAHASFIAVPGGPEALLIDGARGRAYTHLWKGTTLAVDLESREIVSRWSSGCAGSRGIALDAKRGFLFVGAPRAAPRCSTSGMTARSRRPPVRRRDRHHRVRPEALPPLRAGGQDRRDGDRRRLARGQADGARHRADRQGRTLRRDRRDGPRLGVRSRARPAPAGPRQPAGEPALGRDVRLSGLLLPAAPSPAAGPDRLAGRPPSRWYAPGRPRPRTDKSWAKRRAPREQPRAGRSPGCPW